MEILLLAITHAIAMVLSAVAHEIDMKRALKKTGRFGLFTEGYVIGSIDYETNEDED